MYITVSDHKTFENPCTRVCLKKNKKTTKLYKAYLRLLNGDLGMSAVGTICSPGLTHMMGPSSLCERQSSFRLDRAPHGKVICTRTQTHGYTTQPLILSEHCSTTEGVVLHLTRR